MNYKDLDIEVVHHLGMLGYTLEDINEMSKEEIEEHCWTEEKSLAAFDEVIASRQ